MITEKILSTELIEDCIRMSQKMPQNLQVLTFISYVNGYRRENTPKIEAVTVETLAKLALT